MTTGKSPQAGAKGKSVRASANETLLEPWDQLTLDHLARKGASAHPARPFLRDCPTREAWNGTEPRTLTSASFVKSAEFLAAQLHTLGIAQGERVLILLPNCVELPLAVLACHMAGATPAIAPVDERIDMLRAAAERANASMILTMNRVGDVMIGDKARQIAAKVMHVRAVAGFGFDLPDGIVSLEGWSEEDIMPMVPAERHQGMEALVTFTREKGSVNAVIRSEAQLVAEALALSSVMRLDGRRGLISLMQPGAAISLAASLVLPLHAGASVRLAGPYDTATLARIIAEEPTAFLYAPDHFVAQLRADSLGAGALGNHAGILALTRAIAPDAAILPAGALPASLVVDFDEAGMMTTLKWPVDGKLTLPGLYAHPMDSVLPEKRAMLEWHAQAPEEARWTGFCAAKIIRRSKTEAGRAA